MLVLLETGLSGLRRNTNANYALNSTFYMLAIVWPQQKIVTWYYPCTGGRPPVSDLLLKVFVIVLRSQIGACLLVEMELFLVGYFLARGGRQCYPN